MQSTFIYTAPHYNQLTLTVLCTSNRKYKQTNRTEQVDDKNITNKTRFEHKMKTNGKTQRFIVRGTKTFLLTI